MTKRDVEPSPVPPASEITLDLHALERIVIGAAKSLYHEGGMPEGFSRVIEALIAREDERRQAVAAETSRHEAFDKLTEVIDGIIEDAFMVAESHALAKPDAPQRDAVIACLVEDAVAAIRAAQSGNCWCAVQGCVGAVNEEFRETFTQKDAEFIVRACNAFAPSAEARAEVAAEPSAPETCEWKRMDDESDYYTTGCGDGYIMHGLATPTDRGWRFCCYCSKPLREVPLNGE